jgi:hypothetical protein
MMVEVTNEEGPGRDLAKFVVWRCKINQHGISGFPIDCQWLPGIMSGG